MKRFLLLAVNASFAVASVAAQQPVQASAKIPVRSLGPIAAASHDTLKLPLAVRGLSNGAVLVNEQLRRRVLRFDSTLATATVVMDSANNGNGDALSMAVPSAHLIRYTGDSTLYVDVSSQSFLVLDANGKVGRVMAVPKPADVVFLAIGAVYGTPGIDPNGHLIYRGNTPTTTPPPDPGARTTFTLPVQPDSGPIIRADFDTRKVDTIAKIKVFKPGNMSMTQDPQGNLKINMVLNPLDTGDEWALTSDGRVAIVSAHDYHIDWIDLDGTHRSTPKMPIDWARLTDESKQKKTDSIRVLIDKQLASLPERTIPTADGPRKLSYKIDMVPFDKLPDYEPAISPGAVVPDLEGRLWILPHTTAGAANGRLYDVVDHEGQIIFRVQMPAKYALAGFGPGGVIYVARSLDDAGTLWSLERSSLK